jgi:hypothetical protein
MKLSLSFHLQCLDLQILKDVQHHQFGSRLSLLNNLNQLILKISSNETALNEDEHISVD